MNFIADNIKILNFLTQCTLQEMPAVKPVAAPAFHEWGGQGGAKTCVRGHIFFVL